MKCQPVLASIELPWIRYLLAYFLTYANRIEEALEFLEPVDETAISNLFALCAFLLRCALQRKRQKMIKSITPELVAAAKRDYVYASNLATFYVMLDDKEHALEWIQNAVNHGFINYPYLSQYDPFLAKLRGEPRFEQLMQRVKREWEEFKI